MGRFDGIFICSDIDGTLADRRDIPQRNVDAIRYFQSEGGIFTLATGRNFRYLERLPQVLVNGPMITENGTRIFDPALGRTLWTFPLDSSGLLLEWIDLQPIRKILMGFTDEFLDGVDGSVLDRVLSHKTGELLQIACAFDTEEEAIAFRDRAREKFGFRYDIHRSWPTGVEFISPLGGKGNSLKCLKGAVSDSVHTVIAVGDFENDRAFLQNADRAFAPSNACPEVLELAEKVLCNFREGAIGELIELLDSEYERGRT